MSAVLQDIRNPSLQLPEFLFIDTSLILELVSNVRLHPHHDIAVSFLNRLRSAAQHGDVIPIIPYLVLEEFYFKICKMYYINVAGKENWEQYYKKSPEYISTTIHPVLIQYYQTLKAFPMIILEPEDLSVNPSLPPIADSMTDYIRRFNVLPKDALILSEAKRVGVFHLATLDRDYARADGFTVFLPQEI